jgi:hypothetical protein
MVNSKSLPIWEFRGTIPSLKSVGMIYSGVFVFRPKMAALVSKVSAIAKRNLGNCVGCWLAQPGEKLIFSQFGTVRLKNWAFEFISVHVLSNIRFQLCWKDCNILKLDIPPWNEYTYIKKVNGTQSLICFRISTVSTSFSPLPLIPRQIFFFYS